MLSKSAATEVLLTTKRLTANNQVLILLALTKQSTTATMVLTIAGKSIQNSYLGITNRSPCPLLMPISRSQCLQHR